MEELSKYEVRSGVATISMHRPPVRTLPMGTPSLQVRSGIRFSRSSTDPPSMFEILCVASSHGTFLDTGTYPPYSGIFR